MLDLEAMYPYTLGMRKSDRVAQVAVYVLRSELEEMAEIAGKEGLSGWLRELARREVRASRSQQENRKRDEKTQEPPVPLRRGVDAAEDHHRCQEGAR